MNEYDATEIAFNNGYENGYADGVRDFAARIRQKERTWSISEIEADLLRGEKLQDGAKNSNM